MTRWRQLRAALLLAALLFAAVLVAAQVAAAQSVLPREVRQRILQAVVDVRPYDSARNRFAGSAGSGTIISPDGFVLTNFHVVGDDQTGVAFEWHGIFVTDPRAPDQAPVLTYWARFVAGDARHDLAVIQIVEDRDENPLPAGFRFISMPVGDSGTLIPGDPLTVVGYPGISGATITFTSGVVSGFLGEDLTAGGKQWIKTDAKLARGNSGGAAFDENGVLVAVPTLRLQTDDGGYIEQQDYLRPVALAWPLITTHVANVDRVGGVGSQVAGLAPGGATAAAVLPTPTPRPAPGPRPTPITPATPGVTVTPAPAGGGFAEVGLLEPGDDTLGTGEYVDVVLIDVVAGVPVELALTSAEFDVYLLVVGPDASLLLEADDSPGQGTNVAERFVPTVSGTYTIGVTSYTPGETGAYELRVVGASRASGFAAAPPPADAPPGVLVSERGVLSPDDVVLDGGEYVQVFGVDLRAGVAVAFELASTEFDVYLVVLGPDEEVVLEVDDTPGHGIDVAETFVPAVSGRYLVAVTSAFAEETGAYTLVVREGSVDAASGAGPSSSIAPSGPATGPRSTDALGRASGIAGPLAIGAQVRAELDGVADQVAYHTYLIEVPAGAAQLVVEMAADVDLDLFMKFGSEIASLRDDGDWDYRDIEVAPRASFTVAAPRAGTWYVDVVWYGGEGIARYTLRAR